MTTTMDAAPILIADDDASCRETLRDILEPMGYRTRLACDGAEAVDIVRTEPVQLALFDMHMPRLTGVEAVRIVRTVRANLPCILVTADANEQVLREAFTVRVFSVIPKPVSRNILLYTLVRALSNVQGKPSS